MTGDGAHPFPWKTKGGEKPWARACKGGRKDQRGGARDEKEEMVNKGSAMGGDMGWADKT